MRGSVLFVAGILVGVAVQAAVAQSGAAGVRPIGRLNHVAISVPNLPEALKWYGEKMGFQEVIRNTNAQGVLMSVYVQASKDTFVELQQANEQRPAGLNHWGIEVTDLKAAVATYRSRGATVSDVTGPSAFSGGFLANVTDPNTGGRIELSEQPADTGKLRKATEAWKP